MSYILFAEDDDTLRTGLEAAFASEGYETLGCADGEAVLAVEAVTVGVAESHGVTLFALVPFNGVFASCRRAGGKRHGSGPAPGIASFLELISHIVSGFREIYAVAVGAGDGHKARLVVAELALGEKFQSLRPGGHTPPVAKGCLCGIVFPLQDNQFVGSA